ncbi:MAG: hypothetical protein HY371_04665 [Devosia nanyangense]|nr:hypothetical protein [Devosia nanyangense]
MKLPSPPKRMLTKDEAASYCGFPSVARFEAMARVRPVNYGNCVRYDRERLDEWLDTLSQSPEFNGSDIVEALFNEGPRDRH